MQLRGHVEILWRKGYPDYNLAHFTADYCLGIPHTNVNYIAGTVEFIPILRVWRDCPDHRVTGDCCRWCRAARAVDCVYPPKHNVHTDSTGKSLQL